MSLRRALPRILLAAALLTTVSCSKDDDGGEATVNFDLSAKPVETGFDPNAKPTRGGQLVYGTEADNISYCLPEGQMAMTGMQVTRAIYDPLVLPNAEGGYSPYLAKSVEPSDDFMTWTIKLRPGIKFHDGSPLDAKIVRDNLDAYRGAPEYGDDKGPNPRASLLLTFLYEDIDTVTATDELTVTVKTKRPWVAFPASLYGSGRVAMLARVQLEAEKADCEKQPVGTGPFEFSTWDVGRSLRLTRNENYWQKAPDGEPYPYVNAIEFRPMPNDDGRIASLQRGDINIMHSSTASDMASSLARLSQDRAINLLISEERTESYYALLNSAVEPFDTQAGRIAASQAINRKELNELANRGLPTLTTGPFTPDVMGFLDDNGAPGYDLEAAKKGVAKLKAEGKSTTIDLITSTNPSTIRLWSIFKNMLTEAGFTVNLQVELQTDLISRVIAGEFGIATWRNQPGDDPDVNSIWWHGGENGDNLVNFGNFDDAVIDKNLDLGRENPDETTRRKAYEAVNRQLGEQAYNIWLFHQPWAVATAPNIHGVLGPDLPNGDKAPGRLATGHPLIGLWIDNSLTTSAG